MINAVRNLQVVPPGDGTSPVSADGDDDVVDQALPKEGTNDQVVQSADAAPSSSSSGSSNPANPANPAGSTS
jgi:hypothetical protein